MAIAVKLKVDAELEGFAVDGSNVAATLENNARAGVPVLHYFLILNAATGNVDVVVEHRIAVVDAWVVKQGAAGGAGDTVQVTDGEDAAITEVMSINVADRAVVRAAQIDDATSVIPANGILRVKRTKASAANVRCTVFVLGVRR